MKKLNSVIRFFTFLFISFTFTNCVVQSRAVVVKSKPLPPGQAKKVHGEKSARNHAPGHNK
jgi:hypothetical protein